jgi:hypothetical protein
MFWRHFDNVNASQKIPSLSQLTNLQYAYKLKQIFSLVRSCKNLMCKQQQPILERVNQLVIILFGILVIQ